MAPVFVAGDSGPVIYSASDLAAAARCEYALLRSFDGRLGRGPAVVGDDELLIRTAELGDDHEHRHLTGLRPGGHEDYWDVLQIRDRFELGQRGDSAGGGHRRN